MKLHAVVFRPTNLMRKFFRLCSHRDICMIGEMVRLLSSKRVVFWARLSSFAVCAISGKHLRAPLRCYAVEAPSAIATVRKSS
jgi:hypothetical protein